MRVIGHFWAIVLVVAVGCSSAPAVSPGASGNAGVPSAFIDSPVSGTNIAVGETLQVTARGVDTTGVTRLDLRVGNVLVASATTPGGVPQQTFSALLEWTPSAEGEVEISALAYRADGTGSLPATLDVTVGTSTGAATPTPARPTVGPSAAPGPTAAPTEPPATPRPTRRPRPTDPPTPPPTAADLEVFMQDEDVPTAWKVGVPVQFQVYIRNNDPNAAAPASSRIEVFAAGDEVTRNIRKKRIAPSGIEHYAVTVTPRRAGERALRITVFVPDGYVDSTPGNNVFRTRIEVESSATPAPSVDTTPSP